MRDTPDPPPRPADPLIGRLVGEYRVTDVLGRGGMGTVYRADDTALGIPVALKAIAPQLAADDAFTRRFRTEARAMARAASPHIVRVMALREVELDGRAGLFIVMEYVDGGDLHARMADGPVAWPELWPLLRQMLLGLAAAHAVGVIHRDVKPRNVLLTAPRGAAGPTVKLTDFGLARLSDSDATRTQAVAGTLAYMSPEQVRASPTLDHRSDLFSLALVAYEALAGRLPFARDGGEFTVMRSIVEEPFAPPTEFADVPDAVAGALMRALEKDPDARYESADAFREALAAAGDDLGVTVTRAPARPRPPAVARLDAAGPPSGAPPSPAVAHPTSTDARASAPARRPSPALLSVGGLAVAAALALGWWLTRPATLAPVQADGVAYLLGGEPLDGAAELAPGTYALRCLVNGVSATTEVEVGRGQTRRPACVPHPQAVDVAAFWDGRAATGTVIVDGADTLALPARVELPTGRHRLRVRSVLAGRTRSGALDSLVAVTVRPRFDPEPPEPLAVAVRAGENPTPPQPPGPRPPPVPVPLRPDPPRPSPLPPGPTPAAMGLVDATVAPGVTLSVDGSGMSGGSRELRPGTYTARCQAGPLSDTRTLTVRAGQRTPVSCYAPVRSVRVSVTAADGGETPWMSVVVDGAAQGQTPTQVSLPVGRHSVFVKRRGYAVVGEDMVTVDVPPRFSPDPLPPVPLSFQVRPD